MRRKPSASHWVQNMPLDRNRPSSAVLADGLISLSISSVKRVRHARDGQRAGRRPDIPTGRAVQRHRQQRLVFARQHQRAGSMRALDRQLRLDARGLRFQREIQMHGGDAELRRLIIGKMDGAGFFGTHGDSSLGRTGYSESARRSHDSVTAQPRRPRRRGGMRAQPVRPTIAALAYFRRDPFQKVRQLAGVLAMRFQQCRSIVVGLLLELA